jgi:hypothetical protein
LTAGVEEEAGVAEEEAGVAEEGAEPPAKPLVAVTVKPWEWATARATVWATGSLA